MKHFIVITIFSFLGFLLALLNLALIRKVKLEDETAISIGKKIASGAMTFLKKEYTTIAFFIVIVFTALTLTIGINTAFTFLLGSLFSMFAGYIGMYSATISNTRTAEAAKKGLSDALIMAFTGGSVMGISVASLGLLGVCVMMLFNADSNTITGFAMGASSIALFARVGGGIFTKSADLGADIVGKIESNIPEDDPRNPAVIADNVGDNVGDTAGMGADLFESYVGSIIATIVIGLLTKDSIWIIIPLVLPFFGLIFSLMGIFFVRQFSKKIEPQLTLRYSTWFVAFLFIVASFFYILFIYNKGLIPTLNVFIPVLCGLLTGLLIGIITEYFTSSKPIHRVAEDAITGPAITVLSGYALGNLSTVLPIIVIMLSTAISYVAMGIYGVALSSVGMLSIVGMIMSVDAYGPIADNAGGISEMSHFGKETREITDKLDSLGNTTAAMGKGFAIGSAALTSLALLSAFSTTIKTIDPSFSANITSVVVLIGLFVGALLPYFFVYSTIKAVADTANSMVLEVRRQFKEIDGLLEGRAEPDTDKCVSISTISGLKKMVSPALVAVITPLVFGFLLGPKALMGLLAGAIISGVISGIMMANSGAIWDNAKKLIETGKFGGKGSDAHKAAVVADMIGDPFKDTSGPSLNILIKLLSIVSLVFAPLIARTEIWMGIFEFIKTLFVK